MNLHISGDDKFIDFYIDDIEMLGLRSSNDFIVYLVNDAKPQYVINEGVRKIILNSIEWHTFFKKEIKKYDRVFIHYLDGLLYDVIQKIPTSTILIWYFYGNDGFLYFPANHFLQPLTKNLYQQLSNGKKDALVRLLSPLYSFNRRIFLFSRRRKMKAVLKRFDFFANFLISDYYLIKEKTGFRFKHQEVTFVSLEALLGTKEKVANNDDEFSVGHSILIGNSATITNNHLDIFARLTTQNMQSRKIYCPLSYGDKTYGGIIDSKGRKQFPDNFLSLRSFLSQNDYNVILRDCGYIFMNHDRTQGAGNIIVGLYNGAKVFLSNQSGCYHFLKNLGITVFSIQDDVVAGKDIFTPLLKEEMVKNRRLIREYFQRQEHEKRLLKALHV